MSHKAWCDCPRCIDARMIERQGKPKRFLPKHVLAGIQEKAAKEEEAMLLQGRVLLACPDCHHRTYMKIAPVMKCEACGHLIK